MAVPWYPDEYYEQQRKAEIRRQEAQQEKEYQAQMQRLRELAASPTSLVFWSTRCPRGCTAGGWTTALKAAEETAKPCPHDGSPREPLLLPLQ